MLFKQMESDIVRHLPKKATLDEIYAQIAGEDVVAKRIENLLAEEGKA